MAAFAIGDTVRIAGRTMTGNVGTVVHVDDKRSRYLVRVGATAQDWFTADDLVPFSA